MPEGDFGAEVRVKKSKRVIGIMLAGVLVLGMAGCGKKNTYQGGEGTNFPYTWKEESKGSVLIRLDGKYGPEDYRWTAVNSDEEVVKVEVVKKEKKGIISYRVTPLSEGSAQVTFIRQRETQEAAESAENVENTENTEITGNAEGVDTTGSTADGGTAVRENGDESGPVPNENGPIPDAGLQNEAVEAFTPEDAQTVAVPAEDARPEEIPEDANSADEVYERFLERYRVKDVLSEITFQFEADHSGKKGKLILAETKATEQEHKGVMESGDAEFSYKLWEDSSGMLLMSLPVAEEGWETTWEGEYIAPEDPGLPGITISEPEKEDGRYVILRIKSNGTIEGEQSYSIQGLAQGKATLQFTDTAAKRRIIVETEISEDGVVTVLSHKLETL